MKFPVLFKSSETTTSTSAVASWPWAACATDPRTLSFRADSRGTLHKITGSAYVSDVHKNEGVRFPDHWQEEILSPESEIPRRGLRSDRFFFEPGISNSILEEAESLPLPPKIEATLAEMDSDDPIRDFRVSMAEMVEAHGLRDWGNLEKLLACYLRYNGKSNHGYIIGAFFDLLVHLDLGSDFSGGSSSASGAAASVDGNCSSSLTTAETQCSFTCPLSFSSSTYSPASACKLSNVNPLEIEGG